MIRQKPLLADKVFTPKSPTVHAEMYVPRDNLERALRRALSGDRHVVIHGESGSGKSWLYKQVLGAESITYRVANIANAVSFGSLKLEFANLVDREGENTKTGYVESKSAKVNAVVAEGNLAHASQHQIGQTEPFERLLKVMRKKARSKRCCLIFDNLEAALDQPAIIREIANAVMMLDDERYAGYQIKLVLVGTPSDLKAYFSNLGNLAPVANRLREVPEVERLPKKLAANLVHRGLFELMKLKCPPPLQKDEIATKIAKTADYIPQYVQEFGLEVALTAQDEGRSITADALERSSHDWIRSSMLSQYTLIEQSMNSRRTKIGRRNQVIYVICHRGFVDFSYNDIDGLVREEFPESNAVAQLNIPNLLADLASGDHPIVRRSSKTNLYRLIDPRIGICGRLMLKKLQTGIVEKIDFSDLSDMDV